MRLAALSLSALILTLLIGFIPTGSTHAQGSVCAVPANYIEAVDENHRTLLKLFLMVNSRRSPLEEAKTARNYQAMLVSTRHYHENMRGQLPECAQELNLVTIETISATQDVVNLKLAQVANPGEKRYEFRFEQALDHLNERWQVLGEVAKNTTMMSGSG
jgi:hypothetical protein